MPNRSIPYLPLRREEPATAVESTATALPYSLDSAEDPADEGHLKWDLLLLCVAGYIMCAVGRIHQLFTALEVLRPAAITGLVGVGLYLVDRHEERRPAHLHLPTTKVLAALLFWMVLSVPLALRPGNSFDLVFGNFIKTFLMYLIMVGSVRSVRDVERLAFVYLAAVVVYTTVVIARFDVGTGDGWRLSRLYYYDANDFATLIVTAVPLAVFFVQAGRGRFVRLFGGVALPLLTLGFVRAGSRGGLLALFVVAAFIVLRYSAIPLRWRICITVSVTLVLFATASDQYWRQMGTILSDEDYNRTHEYGRFQIWSRGVEYMLQNPLLGLGPGNFQVAEGTLSPFADRQQFGIGVRWNAPHNSFVQAGAELGFPGLILFAATIISAFAALHRADRQHRAVADSGEGRPHLMPALTAALLGFVVGAFFLSLAYSEMLYTLVALAAGLQKVTALDASE